MADSPETLEASVEIDAPPAQVWSLVTDLKAMADRSPQVVRSTIKGGPIALGTRFSNLNRQGILFWPTKGKVVRFEPHHDFAFRIAENKTIWSFELTPSATGGTTLTQRREAPDGISKVSTTLVKYVLGGPDAFVQRLREGMRQTLDTIKAEAETQRC